MKVLDTICKCNGKEYNGTAGEQKMADLLKESYIWPPFANVGVDYFGSIEVKREHSLVKRYGVIFTCLTSQAVHLEIAHSLNTDSCINAFRHFISTRGQVAKIRSDNSTNFLVTEKELKEAIKEWNLINIEFNQALQQRDVKWTQLPIQSTPQWSMGTIDQINQKNFAFNQKATNSWQRSHSKWRQFSTVNH